ncbi:MBL fold metallo-hydrolase [Phocaeicola coprocola]|uniref:MBL fold metallo-hydrolase n=1 Tax=Phocaeicola coprocola TaxID=310298 RepID=UPI00195E2B97|nr:MBL fold metallo-hydrolase [Phocaeicola coprocola]MBM6713426.1 MBL fold metallo-hydrolase [Phocaeicola coprocola]MBM6903556.1 MBL fold metallo-hydrolase [Phocaeicola coprocola]
MKLIYLYHSGFALLGEGYTIIFDYFEDSASPSSGIVHDELLQRPGRLYVLSSHSHADHFNKEALTFREKHPDIVYIFSQDILHEEKLLSTDAVWLKKGDCYADDVLRVHAFGSTDVGISFLVEAEGKKIFHAGDLNNWHWMDESSEAEWKGYERDYLFELDCICSYTRNMDVVMFPVDPRLGTEYMRGARQFVEQIKTSIFVPMHFDEAYDKAAAFLPIAQKNGASMPMLRSRGQEIDL